MRTTLQKLRACVLPAKERNWKVIGIITVVMPDLAELLDDALDAEPYFERVNLLINTLKRVDIDYPWCDRGKASQLNFISMARMEECQRMEYSDDGMSLYFRPENPLLSKGQTYAYGKYLQVLASKLGKQLKMEVRYSIEVTPVVPQHRSSMQL